MAIYERSGCKGIWDYIPDNDKDTLYLKSDPDLTLEDIGYQVALHFNADDSLTLEDMHKFHIKSDLIRTRYMNFYWRDSLDDYDDYIVIIRNV